MQIAKSPDNPTIEQRIAAAYADDPDVGNSRLMALDVVLIRSAERINFQLDGAGRPRVAEP
jgi:hypothetical protein